MEANAGMAADSHKRNEFVMIRHEGEVAPKQLKNMNTQLCQICGDTVGLTTLGDVFVACNKCSFSVCRPCYEYEQKNGNRSCPQCKTRYKRHKGSPSVEGDGEEDGVADLENEFNYANGNGKATLHWHVQGEGVDSSIHNSQHPIPLLTNGQPGASTRAGEIAKECDGRFRSVSKEPRWSDPHCEQRATMVSSMTLD